jgi:hypothetical protein
MQFKIPVIIIILANLILIFGSWMKITGQPFADLVLTITLMGELVGLLWLIIKAFEKSTPSPVH